MSVFQVKTTSRAVKAWPSCHLTSLRSLTVKTVPSFEMPPLAWVGMATARSGTKLPLASMRQRSSKIAMWTPRWLSMVGMSGLKFCGSCEMPTMIWPPFWGVAVCAVAPRTPTTPTAAVPARNVRLDSVIEVSSWAQPRVERVAQPVAGEVEAQHGETDHGAGIDGHPRRVEDVGLRV